MPSIKVLKQILTEPRFHTERHIWEKLPLLWPSYLVSGTTFQNYIVPNLKEQFLFYINLVLDLFCQAGRANSLNKAFSENSSLTIIVKTEMTRTHEHELIKPFNF